MWKSNSDRGRITIYQEQDKQGNGSIWGTVGKVWSAANIGVGIKVKLLK